jgi:hypothetical protein
MDTLAERINTLAKETIATTKKLAEKLDQALQLASAVKGTGERPRS